MGDVARWTVTYTKDVKKKRKVYQDGILHLLSNNKVMLYDESEQLLDSRFLTKDEAVKSGESLAFSYYLVDIGDPESNPDANHTSHPYPKSECADRTPDRTRLPQREKIRNNFVSKGKPNTTRKKDSTNSLSPSQKIIREFKKNEMLKYEVHQSPPTPSATTSSFKEWEALYTKQITQKAKKYHDGFIRVVTCGSLGKQIMLYDSSKNQLDKRFLKKDEFIRSGESLTFDAHLVDIGDPIGTIDDDKDVKIHARSCNMTEKTNILAGWQRKNLFVAATDLVSNTQRSKQSAQQNDSYAVKSVGIEHSQRNAGSVKRVESMGVDKMKLGKRAPSHVPLPDGQREVDANSCKRVNSMALDNMELGKRVHSHTPLRDAHQILSVLKKPATLQKAPSVVEAPSNQCLPQSTELIQSGIAYMPKDFLPVDRHTTSIEGFLHQQSEATHDDKPHLEASFSTHKRDMPVCSQGLPVAELSALESPNKDQHMAGSTRHNRPQASSHNGNPFILEPSEADFKDRHSYESSEAETNPHQPPTRLPEADPRSKQQMVSSFEIFRTKSSTKNTAGCGTSHPVKIENSNKTMDCPSFDLGF